MNSKPTAPRRARRVVFGLAVAGSLIFATAGCATKDKASDGTVADGKSSTAENQPVTVAGTPLVAVDSFDGDPAIDQDAPKLDGFDFQGAPVKYDFAEGPTMLVFLAHWCPHCNAEIPVLLKWKNSGQMPANLKVLGVSTGVDASRPHYPPSKWVPGMGWQWPIMADSTDQKAGQAFGVNSYPYFVIIGTDGKVKLRNSGEVPANQLTPMIVAALNSTPPAATESSASSTSTP